MESDNLAKSGCDTQKALPIGIQCEKTSQKQLSFCLLVDFMFMKFIYVKNKPEKECKIVPIWTSDNTFRDTSQRPLI